MARGRSGFLACSWSASRTEGRRRDCASLAASEGGESLIAKLPAAAEPPKPSRVAAAANPDDAPQGEPNLTGLAEIPLKPWVEAKRDDAKPDERQGVWSDIGEKEALPWDAVEPYRPDGSSVPPADVTASLPAPSAPAAPRTPSMLLALPLASAVEGWVKAKATEIKGEERGRALYHFEFWLDAPDEVKRGSSPSPTISIRPR